MNRPGDGLRRLASRVCSERNRRRLIDPAIADLQAELAAARRDGSRWRTLRSLVIGYVSIGKVLVVAAYCDLRHEAFTWRPEERSGAWQGVRVAAAATAATTVLSIVSVVARINASFLMSDWHPWLADLRVRMWFGIYLLPSTLALTLPLGLVLGTAWALRGAGRSGKLGVAAAVLATACSLGMFVNNVWLTPQASQAFRQIAIARFFHWDEDRPLARGVDGLTLGERIVTARQFGLPRNARYFETLYYKELALTVAAIPTVGIVLALAYRRRWCGARLVVGGVVVFTLYYTAIRSVPYVNALFEAPPALAAWLPNALFAVATTLFAASPVSARIAR